MFYAISWFVSLSLLAIWSLLCWGVHAFTVWAMSSAGALATGAAGAASVQAVLLPAWLQGWIPPELLQTLESWITSAGPVLQGVLESVPAVAGAVTVLAWGIWGLGAIFLLALFGQSVAGMMRTNQELLEHGQPPETYLSFVLSSDFIVDVLAACAGLAIAAALDWAIRRVRRLRMGTS